jgi:hypothetical protein
MAGGGNAEVRVLQDRVSGLMDEETRLLRMLERLELRIAILEGAKKPAVTAPVRPVVSKRSR